MPSPFPGMNPYLEHPNVWHDFHESFMPSVREALSAQLGADYVVKIDERIYVHEVDQDGGRFLGRADVTAAQDFEEEPGSPPIATATIAAPAHVVLPGIDIERIAYVEIRDRVHWQLITLIELLSPANKTSGPDRDQYLFKRREILSSSAHFVELDLLRGGPRMPFRDLPDCHYYAMVSRAPKRPRAEVWPIRVRERLPKIPIPLKAPSADAVLDLQEIVHRIYDAAHYERWIYRTPPQPALDAEDQSWSDALLQATA